jgi:hypothetical protein
MCLSWFEETGGLHTVLQTGGLHTVRRSGVPTSMCITSNLKGGSSTYLHFMSVRKLSPSKTLKLEPPEESENFSWSTFLFCFVRGSQVGGGVASRLYWSLRGVTSIYVQQMLLDSFFLSFMCLLYIKLVFLLLFTSPTRFDKWVKLIHVSFCKMVPSYF